MATSNKSGAPSKAAAMKRSMTSDADEENGLDTDNKGLKEGSAAEEAADRKEQGNDQQPNQMKKAMPMGKITQRSPKRNRAQVI